MAKEIDKIEKIVNMKQKLKVFRKRATVEEFVEHDAQDPLTYIKEINFDRHYKRFQHGNLKKKTKSKDIFTAGLTDSEKEELKRAFDKYDKRQTGVIRAFNIPDVMRSAGQNPTNDEAQQMMNEAGMAGTEIVLFNDILLIAEKYWKTPIYYDAKIKEAFSTFDKENTGMVNFEELKEALLGHGEQLDEDDIEMIESVVEIYDGRIVANDFIELLLQKESEMKKMKKKKPKAKTEAVVNPTVPDDNVATTNATPNTKTNSNVNSKTNKITTKPNGK